MSDSQEAKRERQLMQRMRSMRENGYGSLDDETIYRLAINSPAGVYFGGDGGGMPWAPGTVLSPDQVQGIVGQISKPGFYVGGDGMTLDQYLADPRSAVKVENGQYVYRPELMQGDFESIDRQSFLDDWGAFGLIAGAMGGLPLAASLGAAGAGAAAAGAGDFAASFAPTITPSTVAQSGLLYSGGSMPTVAGLSGVGGLTAEGMTALGAMGSAGAGLGAGTTGALGSLGLDAAGNIVSGGLNLANGGTSAGLGAAATGAGSAATSASQSALARMLDGSATIDDWLKFGGTALSGVLGMKSASDQQDAFTELSNKYLNLGAPARARLEQSYADPQSFLGGPDVQAITQQGSDAAARSLSTTYGNPAMSPNAWAELNRINTGNQWNQLSNYRNQLAAQGGLGIAPAASFDGGAASTTGQGANIAGAIIGDLTSPKKSMLDQMRDLAEIYSQRGIFGGQVIGA